MALDAEIPLMYDPKPLGPDPNQTMSMLEFAQKFRQDQQAQKAQNALKQILASPDAFDPKTNLPSPKAIRAITQIDPQIGIKLQEDTLDQQVQRAQIAHTQTEAGKQRWDFATSVAGIGYDAYKDKKEAGASEADAIAAGQAARNEAIKANGGQISDDDADGMLGVPFEPDKARALAQANKEYVTSKHDNVIEDVMRGGLGVKQADAGLPVTGGASGATGGAATSEAGSDDALTSFAKKLDASENATGDPHARPIDPKTGKPLSSAMGNGQFTESTWLENAKQNHPEWVKAGLTDKQILALRGDPDTSLDATVDNAKKNAGILTADNIPVTGANLAIAHKAGPGDAPKIINAPPETPMQNIVSPEVMRNLGVKLGTTAGQYVGGMVAQFGAAPLAIGGGGSSPAPGTIGKGFQVMYSPSLKSDVRYNPARAVTTDMNGKPITNPGDLTKTPAGSASTLSDDAADLIADQVLAGNRLAVSGLARNANSIAKVNEAIARKAKEQHLSGAEIAARQAEFGGMVAGERTLGVRTANMEVAANEVKYMAPLALAASEKVDRTKYPTLNSIILAAEKGTGGEDVVTFGLAANALIYSYAKFLNPTGIPTDADKAKATDILSTDWAKGQFSAAVKQIQKEIGTGKAAVRDTKEEITGKTDAPEKAASGSKSKFEDGQTLIQNGNRFKVKNGKPVYVGPAQ
jgi:hypothetical protein